MDGGGGGTDRNDPDDDSPEVHCGIGGRAVHRAKNLPVQPCHCRRHPMLAALLI